MNTYLIFDVNITAKIDKMLSNLHVIIDDAMDNSMVQCGAAILKHEEATINTISHIIKSSCAINYQYLSTYNLLPRRD